MSRRVLRTDETAVTRFLIMGLRLGFSVACLDTILGLWTYPAAFLRLATVAASFLTTWSIFLGVFITAMLPVYLGARFCGWSLRRAASSIVTGLSAFFVLAAVASRFSNPEGNLVHIPPLLVRPSYLLWAALSSLVGLVSYRILRPGSRTARAWTIAAYVLPVLLAFALASTWLMAWSVNDRGPGEGGEASASLDPAAPHRIRRVVLLTVDTLRPDFLSSFGGNEFATPGIDSLAEDGAVFTQAISPAPWTKPALASLMTGLPVTVHGMTGLDSRLSEALPTLAESLRDSGYLTAAFVRNPHLEPGANLSRGFTTYNLIGVTSREHGGTLGYWVYSRVRMILGAGSRALSLLRERPGVWTDYITDLSIAWLNTHRDDDFFLWIHYFDPHQPYAPPARFLPDRDPPSGMSNSFGDHRRVRNGSVDPDPEQRMWIRDLYAGEVRHVDESVGRLLDTLEKLEIYDDTLIVFTSDHGEEFWEHGRYEHGHSLYQEVLRVPLIFKLPKSTVCRTIPDRVSTQRIKPTILDLCFPASDPDDSASALSALWDSAEGTTDAGPVFSNGLLYFEEQESIVFGDFKYIRSRNSPLRELFALSEDPQEEVSILAVPGTRAGEAEELLRAHREKSELVRKQYGISDDERFELDADTRQRLRSLGYID